MRRSYLAVLCFLSAVFTLLFLMSNNVQAYPQYSQNKDATNCRACHGDFRASPYISRHDGANWGDDLHDVHRNGMLAGDCDTCHNSGPRFPVLLGESAGGSGFDPISCLGCHGRTQDDSVANGGACVTADCSPGAGLQQHHFNAGVTICVDCHDNADPNNYLPVGEDVPPPYYFTPDAGHPNKPSDPCVDDFIGGPTGLDNDGDGDYDEADPDCGDLCGNGAVDDGEDCDPSVAGTACCAADCTYSPSTTACGNPEGSECDNADTCAGDAAVCNPNNEPPGTACGDQNVVCLVNDTCDGEGACTDNGNVLDGTSCGDPSNTQCGNPDTCQTGACQDNNEPAGAICEDGEFCTDGDVCDGTGICAGGADSPCLPDETCDEDTDTCDQAFIDLDIAKFSAPKSVRLAKVKPVEIKLVVKNSGDFNSQTREATVTGMQNGDQVFSETQDVSDDVGDGRSTYIFGPYTPTATGDILWTATIDDDDPDDDTATAVTKVK